MLTKTWIFVAAVFLFNITANYGAAQNRQSIPFPSTNSNGTPGPVPNITDITNILSLTNNLPSVTPQFQGKALTFQNVLNSLQQQESLAHMDINTREGAVAAMPTGRSSWVSIYGGLKQISFDGRTLCGVNQADEIFIATTNLKSVPNWKHIEGGLKHVVVLGAALYGVNANDDIFYGRSVGDPRWLQLPGKLKQISYDGTQLVGCNSNDDIYIADTGLQSSPNWRNIEGKLKHVVVWGDTLYGVNARDEIYVGKSAGSPSWVQIPGSLKQIGFDGKRLSGVNDKDQIYLAETNLKTSPNWHPIPGSLKYVESFENQLYGINAMNTIQFNAR